MNCKLYKITGEMLEKGNYDLKLTYKDATKKGLVIAFSESQVIDWLYELRRTTYKQESARYSELKGELKNLKRTNLNKEQREERQNEILKEMHDIIFIDELIQVDFKTQRQFDKATRKKGFKVNGITYRYLVSKGSSTITFINKDLYDVISKRLDADRDVNEPQYASKLNAYKSLAFSTSEVVTTPNKVIVIPDCNVQFQAEYLWVADKIEPKNEMVERNVNDGYGFIDIDLAKKWTKKLNHEGILSAFQIRTLFTKGVLVPVDYKHFCESKGVTTVKDIWGNEQNILDADVILSESLVKLWSSYNSCEEWLNAIETHKYDWRVSKFSHAPKSGYTNYQQMLPLDLDLNDIDELLEPSIQQLKAVAGEDYVSTCLYLNGTHQDENMLLGDKKLATALQIEPELINDVYLKRRISTMISKTKNDIKLGRMSVNASFQIIVGDITQLLQHLIGVSNPKGVLNKYEIYSYHHEEGTVAVASRCPLLVANNLVTVTTRKDMGEWNKYFEYLQDIYVTDGCSLINESLCGFDFDGDTLQLITEKVFVRRNEVLLPIKCASINGNKEVIKDDKPLIKASRVMIGDGIPSIGSVINDASKMFSVMSKLEKGSKDYEKMEQRLIQMVKISQSVIDAKKSGEFFRTPSHWVNASNCSEEELKYVADKRPYFFIHNYDKDKKEYRQFENMVDMYSVTHWNLTGKQLLNMSEDKLTDEQKEYLDYATKKYCKLSLNDGSTMWKLTNRADDRLKEVSMSRKGQNTKDLLKIEGFEPTKDIMTQVERKYEIYIEKLDKKMKDIKNNLIDKEEKRKDKMLALKESKEEMEVMLALIDADDETICNALLEITYKKGSSCSLVWDLYGDLIIENLLKTHNYEMNIIVEDENGTEFKGKKYSTQLVKIEK